MTEKINKPILYETDYTKFGGLIHISDFNTECKKESTKGSTIAQRIISDRSFDTRCRNNIKGNLCRRELQNDK